MTKAARRRLVRPLLLIAALLLLAGAWPALAPERLQGRIIPLDTAGVAFNLSLAAEVRASVALLGLAFLLAGLLGRRLLHLADRLAAPLAKVDGWLRRGRRWQALLLAFVLLAALALAGYSITRFSRLNAKAYDLGLHAQVFWNTGQGRLFASSVEVDNYLGDHVSPIILLLAPLYRLWPDPRTLLAVQALALAGGALPLAWLARRRLAPYWPQAAHLAALLLALVYLTYPALGFANRFEFHEEALVVPLFLLAFWFLERERPAAMSAALGLALLCKEDIGLSVAAFGVHLWWRRPPCRRLGLVWLALGLGWSLLALLVVIPAFRGVEADALGRYAWLGGDPAGMALSLLQDPGRLLRHLLGEPRRLWFLVKFLLPLGFLPLLSPATLLLALPALAVNWLAGNLYQASIYFHYALPIIPFLFAAAVYGLERLAGGASASQRRRQAFLLLLVACAALALAFDHSWQRDVGPDDWEVYGVAWQVEEASVGAFAAAAALLPADGAVATTEAYAPHLANRQGLYLLHDPRILQVADRVDWVLVDLSDHRYGVNPRLYYGLLRWIADRRGLSACAFAADVVLLGPACAAPAAAAAYQARLAELQQATASLPLDPALVEALGAEFFEWGMGNVEWGM